jgi:c-di-GMP-binding flagellar brake protein YcgR
VKFVERTDCSFQSLILKVDAKKQSLLIDELFPLQPGVSIIPGEHIEITTSGKGLPVKFKSAIGTIEILDGSPAYRIILPRKVKANQRREFFRVAVSREMETELRIVVAGGSLVHCDLFNISSSGIGFSIDKNITEQIQSSRILQSAKLFLPDNSILQCDLEVRCYEYRRPPHRCTAIGARFVNLSPASQRVLDKLVTQLQRERRA